MKINDAFIKFFLLLKAIGVWMKENHGNIKKNLRRPSKAV